MWLCQNCGSIYPFQDGQWNLKTSIASSIVDGMNVFFFEYQGCADFIYFFSKWRLIKDL
jgi:hypothetical protein